MHVAWDLDNKKPLDWSDIPEVVGKLRESLSLVGRVVSISAWGNRSTFDWVEGDNALAREEEREQLEMLLGEEGLLEQDPLRCTLCGRRCKSLDALQKHFKELHQREHRKRLGPGKGGSQERAKEYLASDQADRYYQAYNSAGMSKKLSRKGRALKALLSQLGVKVKEVSPGKDVADKALVDEVRRKMASKLQAQRTTDLLVPDANVLVVVSDDYGFRDIMIEARQQYGWGVVVVCNDPAKFSDVSDARLPWGDVCY